MSDTPIACQPSALSDDQRQRHAVLGATLSRAVEEVRELPDGYAFRYRTDDAMWLTAAEYADLERRCCPFFAFGLERATDGTVWLRFTGREGVKECLAAQMQSGEPGS